MFGGFTPGILAGQGRGLTWGKFGNRELSNNFRGIILKPEWKEGETLGKIRLGGKFGTRGPHMGVGKHKGEELPAYITLFFCFI